MRRLSRFQQTVESFPQSQPHERTVTRAHLIRAAVFNRTDKSEPNIFAEMSFEAFDA